MTFRQQTFQFTEATEQPSVPTAEKTIPLAKVETPKQELEQASLPQRELSDLARSMLLNPTFLKPYGYQWPASRLSRNEMIRLTIISNAVKKPLNQLIKEAVSAYAVTVHQNRCRRGV